MSPPRSFHLRFESRLAATKRAFSVGTCLATLCLLAWPTESKAEGPPSGDGGYTLALGEDMSSSIFLSGKTNAAPTTSKAPGTADKVKVTINSLQRRTISIFAFGAKLAEGRHQVTSSLQKQLIEPSTPLVVEVIGKDPVWYVQVVDVEASVPTEADVFGAPAADAKVAERSLDRFSSMQYWRSRADESELAARLFTHLDPKFFVYVTKALECMDGSLEPNEVVLVEDVVQRREVNLRRANGQRPKCSTASPDSILTTQRPARVVIPPALVQVRETENLWKDEEFLSLADSNERIGKYAKRKQAANECFDKTWSKLDPDGVANRYDLVSFDKKGRVSKIEDYGEKIQRKVDKACKLDALMKERSAIRAEQKKELTQAAEKRLEPVRQRFAAGG